MPSQLRDERRCWPQAPTKEACKDPEWPFWAHVSSPWTHRCGQEGEGPASASQPAWAGSGAHPWRSLVSPGIKSLLVNHILEPRNMRETKQLPEIWRSYDTGVITASTRLRSNNYVPVCFSGCLFRNHLEQNHRAGSPALQPPVIGAGDQALHVGGWAPSTLPTPPPACSAPVCGLRASIGPGARGRWTRGSTDSTSGHWGDQ